MFVPPEQQQSPPAIDGVFGKDWCMDLWREDKAPSLRKEPDPAMTSMGPQVSESFANVFTGTENPLLRILLSLIVLALHSILPKVNYQL